MSFEILAHNTNLTGPGFIVVQAGAQSATIIDANNISFDGGVTTVPYTYLGQGNFRGFGQSAEFIEVGGEILAYPTEDPDGRLRTGNWKIPLNTLNTCNPPCFLPGTLIRTPRGEVAVEELKAGDRVLTVSGRHAPILWAGYTRISEFSLRRDPSLRPVRIGVGVLGNARALEVSQQHRLLFTGAKAELFFGEPEVLVPAKSLLGSEGVSVMAHDADVIYHHLLLDTHETIYANGVEVESLFLGDQIVEQIPPEVWAAFPEAMEAHRRAPAARYLTTVTEGRALVA